MKVVVKKIGGKALELREYITASQWDMDSEDIHFLDNIFIKCRFVRKKGEINVDVSLRFVRDIRCSRCLEWNKVESHDNFLLIYKDSEIKQGVLEVDADIREKILLDWPLKPLCKPDCRGICPGCGRNLNREKCICNSSSRVSLLR